MSCVVRMVVAQPTLYLPLVRVPSPRSQESITNTGSLLATFLLNLPASGFPAHPELHLVSWPRGLTLLPLLPHLSPAGLPFGVSECLLFPASSLSPAVPLPELSFVVHPL